MQRTAGPVAKGFIKPMARSRTLSTSIVSIELEHDDYWFEEHVTTVTSLASDKDITWGVTSSRPELWIEPSDGSQHGFMFATRKLVVGQASTSAVAGSDTEVSEANIQRSSTGDSVDNATR